MIEVLYSTGIRRSELAGLAVFDIDQDRHTLLVRQGKGRKDRMVPIGERALIWVDRYLAEVRHVHAIEPDDGSLFLTVDGTRFSLDRLTQLVRGYVERSGVNKQGACHLFRHTLATLMLEGGADIRYVQQMLGHADISTTQIYTQVSIRHLQAIHAATHPAASNTPRSSGQVHPVHRGVEPLVSPADLLSVLDEEINQENRPDPGPGDGRATGHPAGQNAGQGDSEHDTGVDSAADGQGDRPAEPPYKRTIIR